MGIDEATAAYADFLARLTPAGLDALDAYCAPDVHFRDPFNDVAGVAAYRDVLRKMFDDLDEPRFVVTHRASADRIGYLRWVFTFRRRRGLFRIEGMSEIAFDGSGKVIAHLDFWDPSAVYELVPLLGTAVRAVRRRLGRMDRQ